MSKFYLVILLFLTFAYGCNTENKEQQNSSKSYSPEKVNMLRTDESLPEEKVEVILKTPEPIVDPTFRKVKWGMSKEEVISYESAGSKIHDQETVLGYTDITVGGLKTYVGYVFIDNKLYRGVYVFDEKRVNEDRSITDSNSLQAILTSKYGNPSEDKITWLDKSDYYKDKPGHAVQMGKLIYYSKWETGETEIYLSLIGENYTPKLRIEYDSTDPELLKLAEQKKKQKNEADF